MILNTQTVDAYTELLTDPSKHNLNMPPLSECFEVSEVATPKHILFQQYIELIQKNNVPKVMFYIIMDNLYPQAVAPSGEFGYLLTIKST